MAAVAAGADAVYLGLKHFSARMLADNFSITELARLAELARERGTKIYVAMNTLVKENELNQAGRLIDRLEKFVHPEALIVQDLAMIPLARDAGFTGQLHLSTLSNVSHPAGLVKARELGADLVVLPRELNVDEIRDMHDACPEGLELEVFVHGALCYCVSGRCYWSGYMGGKTGLRGRCVQPCRRAYGVKRPDSPGKRLFSCLDFSLDVLTKPLLSLEKIRSWKIEGRKKGPHYVFYTTRAYQVLRDEPNNAEAKKMAQDFLDQALGRTTTHYTFLPQRPFSPLTDKDTGSGLFIGSVKKDQKSRLYFSTSQPLVSGDLLRIGYEDEQGHTIRKIRRSVPKRGRVDVVPQKGSRLMPGTKVFLMDRREPELIRLFNQLDSELDLIPQMEEPAASGFELEKVKPNRPRHKAKEMSVYRNFAKPGQGETGSWLSEKSFERNRPAAKRIWWWLPPVIWPNEEKQWKDLISQVRNSGGEKFMLGACWQMALFDSAPNQAWAGPFCNIANSCAISVLQDMGITGAVVSPELSEQDFMSMPAYSPLPLGIVISGLWPLGVSRVKVEGAGAETPLYSPKKEICWHRKYDQNHWIYPGWELDITQHRGILAKAGYAAFIRINEPWPKPVPKPQRTSQYNWNIKML